MAHTFVPGAKAWYASDSPTNMFSAVFEDDGTTGYLYAYDRGKPDQRILDAVLIYNVANVTDKDRESTAEIIWSSDGLKAALLINGRPHALIDFFARCSYCRTEFPPPSSGTWTRGAWRDAPFTVFES